MPEQRDERAGAVTQEISTPAENKKRVEWLPDPDFETRKQRMLERARELHCERAVAGMLAMVDAMEGFTKPGVIFRASTDADIQKHRYEISESDARKIEIWRPDRAAGMQAENDRRRERGARKSAWETVRKTWQGFDIEDPRGASDWLRAIGVLRAAIKPGADIPGVFEVQPPKDDEAVSPDWQKFSDWCRAHYVSEIALSRVAERLRRELPGRSDIENLYQQLSAVNIGNIDQVIMAGYDANDVRVNHYNWYRPLFPLITELSREVETFEEALKAGKQARNQARFEHSAQRTDPDSAYRLAFEDAMKRLNPAAPQLEISNQSAAMENPPIACVVARQSTSLDSTGTRHTFGHGVHPVGREVVKALAGQEALHEKRWPVSFNLLRGEAVIPVETYLVSDTGPQLESWKETVHGPEAMEVFAEWLAKGDPRHWNDDLPFISANRELADNGVKQAIYRSRHRLAEPEDFSISNWYKTRLSKLGNISSVAEAKQHVNKLILHLPDIFPGRTGKILAEIDEFYPTSVTIRGHSYEVEYGEIDDRLRNEPPELSASINCRFDRQDILEWTEADIPVLGKPGNIVKPEFLIQLPTFPGFTRSSFGGLFDKCNLTEIKEVLLEDKLRDAWREYPQKEYSRVIKIVPPEQLPKAKDLLAEPLPPYYTMPNGELKYPALVICAVKDDTYCIKPFAFSIEARPKERQTKEHHERRLEIHERMKQVDPERRAALTARVDEFIKITHEELWKTEGKNFFYNTAQDENIRRGLLLSARDLLKEGKLEEAERLLKKAEERWQAVKERFVLYTEVRSLYDRLVKLNPSARHWNMWSERRWDIWYNDDNHAKAIALSGNHYNALIDFLRTNVASFERLNEEAVTYRREYEDKQARRKQLTPEQRQEEANKILEEIKKIYQHDIKEKLSVLSRLRPQNWLHPEKYLGKSKLQKLKTLQEDTEEAVEKGDLNQLDMLLERVKSIRDDVTKAYELHSGHS